MSYRIIARPEAELTFRNVDYLALEWNNKVMNQFLDRVDDIIQKIKQNPFSFPLYGYETTILRPKI